MDFEHRDPEYQSVIDLCQRVQNSPDACPYLQDLNKLLNCTDSFKSRWTGIQHKCTITKSLLEKRMAICEAWFHDVRTLSEWIEEKKRTFQIDTSNLSCVVWCFNIHNVF